jgi:hypothetical protein
MPAILRISLPNLLASTYNILSHAVKELSKGTDGVLPTVPTVYAGSGLEHYAVSIVTVSLEGTHPFGPPISDAGVVCSLAGCIVWVRRCIVGICIS